jgi:hypothetical protein
VVKDRVGNATYVGMETTTVQGYVWSAMDMGSRTGEKERREKGIIRLIREKGIIRLIREGIIRLRVSRDKGWTRRR